MKRISFIICIIVSSLDLSAQSLTTDQWRDDLRFMASEMPKVHKNLFHTISKAQFDSAVQSLGERIPSLKRHQIIVEMARIAALIGDGHTNIAPTRDPKIGFRQFPIQLYLFKDGLYIRSAAKEYSNLVGARIVSIGNFSVDQAYAVVRTIIGRDNEMGVQFFAPFLLTMPEVLHAFGIIESMENGTFTVEQNGKKSVVQLKPSGATPLFAPDTDTSWLPQRGWIDARSRASTAAPIWLKDPNNKFWFEYLAESRTMYIQFNQVGNKEDETVEQFSERFADFIDRNPVEKCVLDLRLNRGGNGYFNHFILRALIQSKKIDRTGKLFAIIGRGTWSAAQFLCNDLENYTNVLFVGEPTAGKVNSYGDSKKIVLPNSGITVRVSTLWWQQDERDHRQWTEPQIPAPLMLKDYISNDDPAMDAILHYTSKLK